MLKAIFVITGLLTYGLTQGQNIFQKVYGVGSSFGGAWGSSARQTSDGGYIMSGSISDSSGTEAAYIVKTDYLGRLQWSRALSDTTYNCRRRVVQETSDGGYIVIGYAYAAWIVLWKLDSTGNIIWAKKFMEGIQVYSNYGEQTSDGGYIIVGNVIFWPSNNVDVMLIKTDSDGNLTWAKIIGNSGPDEGNYVTQTSDGGYIITGTTGMFPGTKITLVKTDSSGNVSWAKTFNSATDVGNCVRQTSDGGFIIVGYTGLGAFNYNDVYLVKTDSSGNLLWSRTYGGHYEDEGYNVQQTFDGGYIIAGSSSSFGTGNAYLIKTDSIGNIAWSNVFGGSSGEYFISLQLTTDGGYVLAGVSYSFGMSALVYIVKTDPFGVSECYQHEVVTTKTYPLTQSNSYIHTVTSGVVMDSAIAVMGTVSTMETILCEYDAIREPMAHNQIVLSPNPATDKLRIENTELRIQRIEVSDVMGEKIFSEKSEARQQLSISISELKAGVYFITAIDDKGKKTIQKFIKL